MADLTVGVEEEVFVVDGDTLALRPDARTVLDTTRPPEAGKVEPELSRSQLETGSAVCRTLDQLRTSLTELRRSLDRAARAHGARIMPSGTHPASSWDEGGGIADVADYRVLAEAYGQLSDEQVLSGCHVHVGVDDPELLIAVMDRVRVEVPLLLAMSANSPFWDGRDTRYASYRTEVFHRWPTTGLPELFTDRSRYDAVVATMARLEVIDSPARIYWDLRPSAHYPTLELRVSDVQPTVEEAVVIAGLFRALVAEAVADHVARRPLPTPRPELCRAALWRAARHGLDDRLLDLRSERLVDATDLLAETLDRVAPHLDRLGDRRCVTSGVERLLADGTGSVRQRRALERRGALIDVCRDLVDDAIP